MGFLRLSGIEKSSLVNGPGVRYTIFMQGCLHACKGCQNPNTWPLSGGHKVSTEDIINDVFSSRYIDGVTFSGGDPFYQPEALIEIAKPLKMKGLNLWAYTGFLYEEILQGKAGEKAKEALSYLDVLVDGPFVLSLLSKDCLYRGSTNQRLIDVPRSLKEGKVYEADENKLDYGLER